MSSKNKKPLTNIELTKLEPLKAVEKLKEKIILNLNTFSLPKGVEASIIKMENSNNTYRVQVKASIDNIGYKVPFDKIPLDSLDLKKFETSKLEVVPKGLRPKHLDVKYFPHRIKLERSHLAKPPFDFDYKLEDELLDKPCNVFAPDDRYIYQDTSFPWRTVGRVDTPLGTGTGCTIGSRLLLTASHLIQWNADNTTGWVRFRPAYYSGAYPFGEAWATRTIFWMKAIGGDGLTNRETAFDYVVCVLDTRIGDNLGYPGYRTYDDDWNRGEYWQHMGYPSDLSGAERPAFQGGCVISTDETESTSGQNGYVLGHFNDVVPGHSGGPVWGWWENEPWPRVVGVQSAEANSPANNTSGDNEFGGGPGLSALIDWARSNYS